MYLKIETKFKQIWD